MNCLTHSRAFVSFLLVMLQLALLPSVGRCHGKLSFDATCCCAGKAPQAESEHGECCGHGCCSKKVSGETSPEDDPSGKTPGGADQKSKLCSCATSGGLGGALLSNGENEAKQGRGHHVAVAAPVVPETWLPSFDAVVARIRGGPTPKAPTGPPLHILYQVFLI